jgi:MFS family permease
VNAPFSAPSKLLQAALLIASSLTIMLAAALSPSLPSLRDHFASVPDAEFQAKLMLTIPGLFIAIAAPFAGFIADFFGRKRLLIWSLALYVLAGSAGIWIDELTHLLVSRAILGVATAGLMTAATALIGDYFQGPQRERFIGLQTSAMGICGVVSLAAGGLLAEWSWRGPYLIFLTPLALIPLVFLHVGEPSAERRAAASAPTGAAPKPGLQILLFAAFLYLVTMLLYATFFLLPTHGAFYLREMGFPGPILAAVPVALANLTQAPTAANYRRFRSWGLSHQTVFALAFTIMGAGFVLMALTDDYIIFNLAAAIAGIGLGFGMPNCAVWLMTGTPPAFRGRVVGGLTMSIFIGQFLSAIAGQGLINLGGGLAGMYLLAGCVVVAAGLGFAIHALTARMRQKPVADKT